MGFRIKPTRPAPVVRGRTVIDYACEAYYSRGRAVVNRIEPLLHYHIICRIPDHFRLVGKIRPVFGQSGQNRTAHDHAF